MQTESHTPPAKSQKPRHLAEKFEGMIGMIMVVAIAILAIGFIYGIVTTGSADPKWMQ